MYRLFNVLCWLWNIYEGAELPSVYFINNTKHCITCLALTQLFPVLISHPEMYTLCSFCLGVISFLAMDAFAWDKWILLEAFLLDFFFQNCLGSISLITHYRCIS